MKNKILFVIALLVVCATQIQAQSWTSASGNLYVNPVTANVGIGITTPNSRLHINNGAIRIGHGTSYEERNNNVLRFGDGNYVVIGEWEGNDIMCFKATKYSFTLGNVGIGTSNPLYKLDVRGIIRANEILVNDVSGSDCVFDEAYQLRPLTEVQSYIQQNQHLPEIPSAQEMQENGVNMTVLQMQLLQKIEELTLYVIQQEQRIQELEEQLSK